MDIAVTGSSGFIGAPLLAALRDQGHRPIALVRRAPAAGADEIRWDPATGDIDAASLEGIDGVIHLAGVGIGDRRWTDSQRAAILESRRDGTTLLASTLAGLAHPPAALVSSSGISCYGDSGDTRLDESSPLGSGFLPEVCEVWESSAQAAVDSGIRTVFARTSVVLHPDGGALAKQVPLFKFFLGGRLGSGKQWMSWITRNDQVRALVHLLTSDLSGPVNLTAPNPVTNAAFTKALGAALRRPTLLPVPKFGPSLLLGRDLAEELLFWSVRAHPDALLRDGFEFEAPTIEAAFSQLFEEKP